MLLEDLRAEGADVDKAYRELIDRLDLTSALARTRSVNTKNPIAGEVSPASKSNARNVGPL